MKSLILIDSSRNGNISCAIFLPASEMALTAYAHSCGLVNITLQRANIRNTVSYLMNRSYVQQ